jgi:hypothetical protein
VNHAAGGVGVGLSTGDGMPPQPKEGAGAKWGTFGRKTSGAQLSESKWRLFVPLVSVLSSRRGRLGSLSCVYADPL